MKRCLHSQQPEGSSSLRGAGPWGLGTPGPQPPRPNTRAGSTTLGRAGQLPLQHLPWRLHGLSLTRKELSLPGDKRPLTVMHGRRESRQPKRRRDSASRNLKTLSAWGQRRCFLLGRSKLTDSYDENEQDGQFAWLSEPSSTSRLWGLLHQSPSSLALSPEDSQPPPAPAATEWVLRTRAST